MGRNRNIIIIVSAVIVLAAAAIIAAVVSGNSLSKNFFGRNITQNTKTQDNAQIQSTPDVTTAPETTPQQSTRQDNTAQPQNTPKNDSDEQKKTIKDVKVKAVYLTGTSAGIKKTLDHYIELVKATELNALVIDIKEGGIVNYESNVPLVKENGLYKKVFNIDSVVKTCHENGVFIIGRIVCFRDNGLATKRADLAIKRPDGSLWREGKLGAWTNPYMEEVWKYNIDIAKEAIDKGFDEIQFDYVRFPTAKKSDVNYGSNVPTKVDAISNFLAAAKKELHDGKGVPVSADVFGIIAESVRDGEAIGQHLERVGKDIDVICPMVYPSHYANSSKGTMGNGVGQDINGVHFDIPDLKPYEVVYNTLLKLKGRISEVEGYNAKVRPYLQDFTATYLPKGYYQEYGPEQVRQQIKAVYDAGYEEWILWDGRNSYTEAALEKE